jgi:inosine-uridine nucleoside N-ribohydrolase
MATAAFAQMTKNHLAIAQGQMVNSGDVKPRRLIIDTDPGVDDAFAIMMTLGTPELHVEAVTSVAGNIPIEVTTKNALDLLALCGRSDIPVARGDASPLVRRLQVASYAHGDDGLLGVSIPASKAKIVDITAAQMITRMVKAHPGEVTILALGPLSNLARAFQEDPTLASQVESIVLMGGSTTHGNVSPSAEFNFYVDPEAAKIVFEAGIPITMVGLNATEQTTFNDAHLKRIEAGQSAVSRTAAAIGGKMLGNAEKRGAKRELHIHDALAAAVLLDPNVVTVKDYFIQIETAGTLTAGESVGYTRTPMRGSAPMASDQSEPTSSTAFKPNTKVAISVNNDRFIDLMLERLAK